MNVSTVVGGIFAELKAAEEAVRDLKGEGLSDSALSIVGSATETLPLLNSNPMPDGEDREGHPVVTCVLGSAAAAAAAGMAMWFAPAGIAWLAAGPMNAALAAGTLGVTLGCAAGGLAGHFIPGPEAGGAQEPSAVRKTSSMVNGENSNQKRTAERVPDRLPILPSFPGLTLPGVPRSPLGLGPLARRRILRNGFSI